MNSKRKPITTKAGQTFEFFDSLDEALQAVQKRMSARVYKIYTLLIEYADGTSYVMDGNVAIGTYREKDVKTLIFNPANGIAQIYGEHYIEDYDNGEAYSPNADNGDRVYIVRGNHRYVYPATRA